MNIKKNIDDKSMFLEAMIRFAEIFANENIGDCEVDIAKIIKYCESPKFHLRTAWDCHSIEDYFKLIEDMIIDGFPIWDFLKISDWTRNIMDKEFEKECLAEEELRKKIYKCYTCEYLESNNTSLGLLFRCNKPIQFKREREVFEFKKICDSYKIRQESL